MAEQQHHSDEGQVHAHISPTSTYIGIFAALVVLTVLTYAVSFIHLGRTNLLVAVVIATVKASLVVLYFMHLKHDTRFNSVVFLGSLLFLAIFLGYTLNDTDQRGEFGEYGRKVLSSTGEWAPGGMPLEPKPSQQNTDPAGAAAIETAKNGPEATMNREGAGSAVPAKDGGADAMIREPVVAEEADEALGEKLEEEPDEGASAKPAAAQGEANTAADPKSNEADPAADDEQDPAADE